MKKLLFIFLLLPFYSWSQGITWTIYWARSPQLEVTNYNIYKLSGTNWQTIGSTNGTNFGPVGFGSYVVTASVGTNESNFSDIVYAIERPVGVRIRATITIDETVTNK